MDEGEGYAYILDSSALLAAILGEPGANRVLEIVDRAAISAVNLFEVFGKLIQKGVPAERVKDRLTSFAVPTISWSEDDVWASADFVTVAWTHGFSLADRVCLQLAYRYHAQAVTTDREWTKLSSKQKILLIR
ncbi:MAG TPA: type II toxin-antitoxin system VapC family toxin [Bryobacteraceae bacterium]|jgi:PIN domain nuclease of toxin-antitoxin system